MARTSHEMLIEADDIPIDVLAVALARVGYELRINPETHCLRIVPRRLKTLRLKRGDGRRRK